jgi:hypothetical protein
MSKSDGGPAFPFIVPAEFDEVSEGMTVRQVYKAIVLAGVEYHVSNESIAEQVMDAGRWADAMIAEDEEKRRGGA